MEISACLSQPTHIMSLYVLHCDGFVTADIRMGDKFVIISIFSFFFGNLFFELNEN